MGDVFQWYYKPWTIVLAIMCFGPLGLILLWLRPRTGLALKFTVSVIVIALTAWMFIGVADYYRTMMDHINDVSEAYGGT